MQEHYFWNDKLPAYASTDTTANPEDYFYALLNEYDASTNPDGDRFSWIAAFGRFTVPNEKVKKAVFARRAAE